MFPNKTYYLGLMLGITAAAGAIRYLYHRYRQRNAMPTKWRRVGKLQQINIFPVKSCAPLKLDKDESVYCDVLGLRLHGVYDRKLMLVDHKFEMITARIYPKMVLIQTKLIDEHTLQLTAPNMEALELNLATLADQCEGRLISTAVWNTKLNALHCEDKYNKWFSRFILQQENGIHLLYYPHKEPVRSITKRLNTEPFLKQTDTGAFCDATSYMLMNLDSIEDLSRRIQQEVNPLQFRGNFHLKMDESIPYAEDKWQWLRIGDEAVFQIVAPCTRCIFPNINIETGERHPNGEPLKTLKKYRIVTKYNSPALGVHLGLRQMGTIQTNDVIYVADQ